MLKTKLNSSAVFRIISTSLLALTSIHCAPKKPDLIRQSLRDSLSASVSCEPMNTMVPAFYSSSVTGIKAETFNFQANGLQGVIATTSDDITTENFRDLQRQNKYKISRNTLIRPLLEKLGDLNLDLAVTTKASLISQTGFLLPVEVINPELIYSRMKTKAEQTSFVNKGDQGLIWSKSLNVIDDKYVLIVENDFKSFDQVSLKKGQILKPSMNNDLYQTQTCQTDTGAQSLYLFKHLENQKELGSLVIHPSLDAWNLYPILGEHLPSLKKVQKTTNSTYSTKLSIADFEIDYKGFVRLPMSEEKESSLVSGQAYDGSFVHYHGGDPLKSDTWGKANTICAVEKLAQAWAKVCKGENCLLQYGDIAFPTNAKNQKAAFAGQDRDPLLHQSHRHGECIDIRPFRKDGLIAPTSVGQSQYDAKQSKEFLKFAENFGAGLIYFNDSSAIEGLKHAATMEGHDDHFHICFYGPEKNGKNFCQ